MASVLSQLQDQRAALLMYEAGELSVEDRAEVERMLAVDADLRTELETVRAASEWFAGAMARADRAERTAVPEAAAVRRVGRAMRQWHARRVATAVPAAPAATLRYPWWAYPLAAAASVVIAFLVWWGNTERPPVAHEVAVRPYEEPVPLDPAVVENFRNELIARSLGVGEYGTEAFMAPPPPELDDYTSLYAAVDPSDANVLMLPNLDSDSADGDGGSPDNDPRTYQ